MRVIKRITKGSIPSSFILQYGSVAQRQSERLLTARSRYRNSPEPPFALEVGRLSLKNRNVELHRNKNARVSWLISGVKLSRNSATPRWRSKGWRFSHPVYETNTGRGASLAE